MCCAPSLTASRFLSMIPVDIQPDTGSAVTKLEPLIRRMELSQWRREERQNRNRALCEAEEDKNNTIILKRSQRKKKQWGGLLDELTYEKLGCLLVSVYLVSVYPPSLGLQKRQQW